MKLVNDGYAQTYVSPEAEALPSWAIWANQAYGVTAEPVVIAFNKQKLPRDAVPRTSRGADAIADGRRRALQRQGGDL